MTPECNDIVSEAIKAVNAALVKLSCLELNEENFAAKEALEVAEQDLNALFEE